MEICTYTVQWILYFIVSLQRRVTNGSKRFSNFAILEPRYRTAMFAHIFLSVKFSIYNIGLLIWLTENIWKIRTIKHGQIGHSKWVSTWLKQRWLLVWYLGKKERSVTRENEKRGGETEERFYDFNIIKYFNKFIYRLCCIRHFLTFKSEN